MMTELSTSTNANNVIPTAWIERLFMRFSAMYGKHWLDQWADVDKAEMKTVWREELTGYSAQEIRRGLDTCKTKAWPPTLPEFLNLCRPPIEAESAWHEAIKGAHERAAGRDGEWSSIAIYWAYIGFGHHDIVNMSYANAKGRWKVELDKAMEQNRQGNLSAIPAPFVALPMPAYQKTAEGEALAKKVLAEVAKPKTDYKAWAKKILENPKGKSHIAVQFAKEALGAAT